MLRRVCRLDGDSSIECPTLNEVCSTVRSHLQQRKGKPTTDKPIAISITGFRFTHLLPVESIRVLRGWLLCHVHLDNVCQEATLVLMGEVRTTAVPSHIEKILPLTCREIRLSRQRYRPCT